MKCSNNRRGLYCIIILSMLGNYCYGEQQTESVDIVEKIFLLLLDLPEDATDDDIISKLDSPNKILAMDLIVRRNITAAVPKLNTIVADTKESIMRRSQASRTLLYFGNKEWIKTIRTLCDSYEPKEIEGIDAKIHLAGTLAMVGDYSQIETVLKGAAHEKSFIRITTARELAKYVNDENSISEVASDALLEMAKNDPNSTVKIESIYALDKLVSNNREIKTKMLEAIEANLDSTNPKLKGLCEEKKMEYENEKNVP